MKFLGEEVHVSHALIVACMMGAAGMLLPHFWERSPIATPDQPDPTYRDEPAANMPDNSCAPPQKQNGEPIIKCKWVFLDENGTRWWVYSEQR